MNKNCTSLDQSKKFIELGIDKNTADMYYHKRYDGTYNLSVSVNGEFKNKQFFDEYPDEIPAWSLAALLNVIPKRIKDYNVLRIDINEISFAIWYDEIGYGVNNNLPNITMESAVDACYEMIIRLNELKML